MEWKQVEDAARELDRRLAIVAAAFMAGEWRLQRAELYIMRRWPAAVRDGGWGDAIGGQAGGRKREL